MYFIEYVKRSQDESFVSFNDLAIHDHFIKNVMSLFDIVHDIKLTNIFKIFVHSFYQIMNELKVRHFVLHYSKQYLFFQIESNNEVQWCIPSIDDFVTPYSLKIQYLYSMNEQSD